MIHIQPLGENSVAGVTLAVVLGGVRGGRRKFHCRANECTARMYWVVPLSIRVYLLLPRCDPSTPLFLLAGERAPRHLESRRDLIFIRLISFVLSSTGGNNRGFSYRRPENMNFHFNFRLTVPSPRRPLSRKFIF